MYVRRKETFFLSIISGLLLVIIVNGGAGLLDYVGVDKKWSTFIALIVGLIVNFIMQFKIFIIKTDKSYTSMLIAYLITDFIILFLNQILFNLSVDYEKEIKPILPSTIQDNYVLLCRLLIGGFVWCILSYPLRKYWVFR